MRVQNSNIRKKNLARYFIIVKGLTQKETATLVDVSEKTMTIWSKKYKWQDAIIKKMKDESGLSGFMELFFVYVNLTDPLILKDIKRHWYNFLKTHEKEINM